MEALVFARPERLQRFRADAAEAADTLVLRAERLEVAVGDYLRATEHAYEATCRPAPGAVAAFASLVRHLGSFVGRVGDAFERLPGLGGLHIAQLTSLGDDMRRTLELIDRAGAGAVTLAEIVLRGAHPRDLRAASGLLGVVVGSPAAVAVASNNPVTSFGRFLDWGTAMARGAAESESRWRSDAHLPLGERLGRAAVDGVAATAGTFAGSAAGVAAGGWLCRPLGPVVVATCASAGARAGGAVGAAIVEGVTDVVLGDERPAPPRTLPLLDGTALALADAHADVAATLAAADHHADFVLERPWLWDDEFVDVPSHPHPEVLRVPASGDGPR